MTSCNLGHLLLHLLKLDLLWLPWKNSYLCPNFVVILIPWFPWKCSCTSSDPYPEKCRWVLEMFYLKVCFCWMEEGIDPDIRCLPSTWPVTRVRECRSLFFFFFKYEKECSILNSLDCRITFQMYDHGGIFNFCL